MVYNKALLAARVKAFEAMKNSQDVSKELITDYSYSGPKRDAKSIAQGRALFDSFSCDYESTLTPATEQKKGTPLTFSVEEKQNHLSYFVITPISGDERNIISEISFGESDKSDKTRTTPEIEQTLVSSEELLQPINPQHPTKKASIMETVTKKKISPSLTKKESGDTTFITNRVDSRPRNTKTPSVHNASSDSKKSAAVVVVVAKKEPNNTTKKVVSTTNSPSEDDMSSNKSKTVDNKSLASTKKTLTTSTSGTPAGQIKKIIHRSTRQLSNPPNAIVDGLGEEKCEEEQVKLTIDEKMALEHRKSKSRHTSDLIKEINKQHSKSTTKSITSTVTANIITTAPQSTKSSPVSANSPTESQKKTPGNNHTTGCEIDLIESHNDANEENCNADDCDEPMSSTVLRKKKSINPAKSTPVITNKTTSSNKKPSVSVLPQKYPKHSGTTAKPLTSLQESLSTRSDKITEETQQDYVAGDCYQDISTSVLPITPDNYQEGYSNTEIDEQEKSSLDYNCISTQDVFDDIVQIAARRVMLGFMSNTPQSLIILQPEIIKYNKTPLYESRLEAMESSIFCAIKSLHSKYFDEKNNSVDTTSYESRKKLMMFILQHIGEDDTLLYWPDCAKERAHKAQLKKYKRPHHTEEVRQEPFKKVRKTDDRFSLHNRTNQQSSISNNVYIRPNSGRGRGSSSLGNNYSTRTQAQAVDTKGSTTVDNQYHTSIISEPILGSKRQFQEYNDMNVYRDDRDSSANRGHNNNTIMNPLSSSLPPQQRQQQGGMMCSSLDIGSQQLGANGTRANSSYGNQMFPTDSGNNGYDQLTRFNDIIDDLDTSFGEPRIYLSPTKVVPNSSCLFTGESIKEGDRFTIRIARKDDYPVLSTPNSSTSKPDRDYGYALCYTSTQIGCLLQILQTIKRCTIVIRLFVEHCFHTIPTLGVKLHPRDLESNMNLLLDYIHSNQQLIKYKSCVCVPQFDMAISLGQTTTALSQ